MWRNLFWGMVVAESVFFSVSSVYAEEAVELNKRMQKYLQDRKGEFDQIPAERKEQLKKLAMYIRSQASSELPAKLTFICTHNSRRSQLAQLWAAAGAAYYRIDMVETFSGGTEATAFNARAVAALERAGFQIEKVSEEANPRYRVYLATKGTPFVCFSKIYDADPNPKKNFCAVMTCAQADKNCPAVAGASLRLAVPYEDPKVADDTPGEVDKYDERCAQIAREMLYALSLVKG
jgi:protein-tyrosine-phosphatase